MNRRSFFGAFAVLVAAPAAALRTKFVPMPSACIGGIDKATYKFWRSQQHTQSPEAYENLKQAMRQMHASCTRGVDRPRAMILHGEFVYE